MAQSKRSLGVRLLGSALVVCIGAALCAWHGIWLPAILLTTCVAVLAVVVTGAVVWAVLWLRPPQPLIGERVIRETAPTSGAVEPVSAGPTEALDWKALLQPAKSYAPWIRWWWPGGNVDATSIGEQLASLSRAGFGGVEINPISAGLDVLMKTPARQRIHTLGTRSFEDLLFIACESAGALGLGVDIANGGGWPPGGDHVSLDEGPSILAFSERRHRGGRRIVTRLPRPWPGLNELFNLSLSLRLGRRVGGFAGRHRKLLQVSAYPFSGRRRPLNPLNETYTRSLHHEARIDLDEYVQGGRLDWCAPPGDWLIVAHWLMPSADAPILSTTKGQAYSADPFDQEALEKHYDFLLADIARLRSHGLRAVFTDTIEYKTKRMAAKDICDYFRRVRGYDLAPYLPVVHIDGRDNYFLHEGAKLRSKPAFRIGSQDDRIRQDYQKTLSDLMIDRFCALSVASMSRRGLMFRAQTYGFDMDIIRAFGAVHIPETEHIFGGGGELFMKLAGAAGSLYNRRVVSCEAFGYGQLDHAITPQRMRVAADKAFCCGVNSLVYHGAAYRFPVDSEEALRFEEEGWFPWSSKSKLPRHGTDTSPGSQFWGDMAEFNQYVSRIQQLLRQGRPEYDIVIYYPYLGFPATYGPADQQDKEPLLGGRFDFEDYQIDSSHGHQSPPNQDQRSIWLRDVRQFANLSNARGVTWTWIDDGSLRCAEARPEGLNVRGNAYRSVVIYRTPAMAAELAECLASLAECGVFLVIVGAAPEQDPGHDYSGDRDIRVRQAMMRAYQAGAVTVPDAASALDIIVRKFPGIDKYHANSDVLQASRLIEDGRRIRLLANLSGTDEAVTLRVKPNETLYAFDAWAGRCEPVEHVSPDAVHIMLPRHCSRVVLSGAGWGELPSIPHFSTVTERMIELEDWCLSFSDGHIEELHSLTDLSQDQELSGRGKILTYSTDAILPIDWIGSPIALRLGVVYGSAEVEVNGVLVGRACVHPFEISIDAALTAGANRIVVRVRPPLRNYFRRRALNGENRYAYQRSQRAVREGLLGPVMIVALCLKPLATGA